MTDDKEALREALKHLKKAEAVIEQQLGDGESSGLGWRGMVLILLLVSALATKYEDAVGLVFGLAFLAIVLVFVGLGCFELYKWLKGRWTRSGLADT
jgi:hypothetical protein